MLLWRQSVPKSLFHEILLVYYCLNFSVWGHLLYSYTKEKEREKKEKEKEGLETFISSVPNSFLGK